MNERVKDATKAPARHTVQQRALKNNVLLNKNNSPSRIGDRQARQQRSTRAMDTVAYSNSTTTRPIATGFDFCCPEYDLSNCLDSVITESDERSLPQKMKQFCQKYSLNFELFKTRKASLEVALTVLV